MKARSLSGFFGAAMLLLFTSGCDFVSTSLLVEPSPTPTVVRNVLATRAPFSTAIVPAATFTPAPTWTVEPIPTAVEAAPITPAPTADTSSTDGFCCLHFAPGPLAQAAETFPAGTEIIYAIWDYEALSQDDRIRRIWIRDDLIWLARDEKWDWEKYGASGTVRDLSIFDYEGSGLQPGSYKLQLYLNDTLQEEGSFNILAP
jgi:hypothetical protein